MQNAECKINVYLQSDGLHDALQGGLHGIVLRQLGGGITVAVAVIDCFVNGVLKTQVDKYANNYKYVVMDNEAGLEHVARGTLPHVDTMLLISDCSRRGIQAVGRIAQMIDEMDLKPGKMGLIVNRAPGGVLSEGIKEEIAKQGLNLLGVLPHDDEVYRCDCDGEPSAKLPENDPMKTALKGIMQSIGI